MLRCVALVRTVVSDELSASFIRVTSIGELGRLLVTASVVPISPIPVILIKEALSSSETSLLTRTTLRDIPEDTFLHSHRLENLKFYILIKGVPFSLSLEGSAKKILQQGHVSSSTYFMLESVLNFCI
jgi:hypothetical protein